MLIEGNKVNSVIFYDLAGANRDRRRAMLREVLRIVRETYRKYTTRFPEMTTVEIAHEIHKDERNAEYFADEAERMRILDAFPLLKKKLMGKDYLWNTLMLAVLFRFDDVYGEMFDVTFEEK